VRQSKSSFPPAPLGVLRHSKGFTLIELLTVVGIIVLITALTVPALRGLGDASGLRGAGTQFENLALAARQNSISNGVLTALAILTDTSSANISAAYRTFMVLQIAPHADGSALATSDWKLISKWETLGTGFIVDDGSDANGISESTFLQSPSIPPGSSAPPPLPVLNYKAAQFAPGTGYAYQIFTPEGRFYSDSQGHPPFPCGIRITEGYYAGSSPTYTDQAKDYYKFIFNDATGQIKIIRP
jgi:prepilin-type N-terminal cleavage/methylation domain-containing protein